MRVRPHSQNSYVTPQKTDKTEPAVVFCALFHSVQKSVKKAECLFRASCAARLYYDFRSKACRIGFKKIFSKRRMVGFYVKIGYFAGIFCFVFVKIRSSAVKRAYKRTKFAFWSAIKSCVNNSVLRSKKRYRTVVFSRLFESKNCCKSR